MLARLSFFCLVFAAFGCNNAAFNAGQGASGSGSGSKNSFDSKTGSDVTGKNGVDGGPGGGGKGGADAGDGSGGGAGGSNGNGGADGGSGTDVTGGGKTSGGVETNESIIQHKLPNFGLLVNDLTCGMCHVQINGDVASTRAVPRLHGDSRSGVAGTWYAASGVQLQNQVTATGGFRENYTGVELPPKFPEFNVAAVSTSTSGHLYGIQAKVNNVFSGNLFITGSASTPMEIAGDIYVSGDLVIKGYYRGRGTIYVAGNVYIPFDLRAVNSAFPFPQDPGAALQRAKQLVQSQTTDALAIASAKSIFLGDLEREQPAFAPVDFTIYTDPETPADKHAEALGLLGVYNWFPGGKAGYRLQYENAINCLTGAPTQLGSFNLIEAFLYARNTIGGVSRSNTYAINGGIIADNFHVIARRSTDYDAFIAVAKACPNSPHPVTGYPMGTNFVNYDYRIKAGLRLLNKIDFGR